MATPETIVSETAGFERSENVTFEEPAGESSTTILSVADPTRTVRDLDDTELSNFFSRPVTIRNFTWEIGTTLFQTFEPWNDYFSNPRVINRLTNYALMRAKLKIKVLINGNGFYYGRCLMSYLPLNDMDELSRTRITHPIDLIAESQRPHIFVDPTDSTGGEMTLPFFWPYDYVRLASTDLSGFGIVSLRSIGSSLKHANGGTSPLTITVMAWAEDVELSGLTSFDSPALVPQMGEKEEANKGVVSYPASVIASIASKLKKVPQISSFARATEIAATAVGDIASIFGFSRPTPTSDGMQIIPRQGGNLASTMAVDFPFKLTVDPKQELTIDPRISGVDETEDPLVLSSFAQRESYLTNFTWSPGTSRGSLLWNARVVPSLWDEFGAGNSREAHLTPMCLAATMFKFWTGSIKFRFQVLCSNYHRGRIKAVYEPYLVQSVEDNTNYMHIIDISEARDFTLEIGNMQDRTLLKRFYPMSDSPTEVFSTTPYASIEVGNGVLALYVMTELTVPNTDVNNDISIAVYVSAGEDIEFFVPEQGFSNYVFAPQMGIKGDINTTDWNNDPQAQPAIVLGNASKKSPLTNLVYTGERIVSFRQMLKRYVRYTVLPTGTASSGQHFYSTYVRGIYPPLRGNVIGATGLTETSAPYNFVNTLMLHLVRACFSGWRGSIRYKMIESSGYDRGRYTVERVNQAGTITQSVNKLSYTNANSAGHFCLDDFSNGVRGSSTLSAYVNPQFEFEVPFYSDSRFQGGKQEYLDGDQENGFIVNFESFQNNKSTIDLYVATGEDFQVYFFSGVPPLYLDTLPNPQL